MANQSRPIGFLAFYDDDYDDDDGGDDGDGHPHSHSSLIHPQYLICFFIRFFNSHLQYFIENFVNVEYVNLLSILAHRK
ncbi:hypothetical protein BLOT_010412 [Blomia tropicalis]|nr:hypothetical protein BLOT_010412 [Blomia tropicalis]